MTGPRAAPAIGVLCSGAGTNLQAILDACARGRLRARVAVVLSDRADAPALQRARRAKIPAHVVDPRAFAGRDAFDRELIRLLEAAHVRLVCLAGFMRMLSPAFVRRFSPRLLNIHPALLPAFPGAHALRDALAWGAKVTGVTVHLVDEDMDHGPIVLQEAVAIRPGDSLARLRARVQRVEHRLYPTAIRMMLEGRVRLRGRTVQLTGRVRD